MKILDPYKDQLHEICRRFGVMTLDLFGSTTRGTDLNQSRDMDFLVDFLDHTSPGYADRFYNFALALEELYKKPVDLMTPRSIKNSLFKMNIEKQAVRIYERAGK